MVLVAYNISIWVDLRVQTHSWHRANGTNALDFPTEIAIALNKLSVFGLFMLAV